MPASATATRSSRITATKFAAIYIIWSVIWILSSDYVTHVLVHGPAVEWKVQSYKGLGYVLVSGLILLFGVRERDRKHRAERAANESMLRSVRRSGLVGIYQWDAQGRITDANSSFLDALGYSAEELRSGKLTTEVLTPPEYWNRDQIASQEIEAHGHCSLYEKQALRKDGTRLDVLVGKSLLEGFTDRGIGYALDVTELKAAQAEKGKLEQQLAQAEKLNALGKLAGGIAHDFNNLLSVVVGYASLSESRLQPGDPARNYATQILRAAESAQKLIRKLLAFSRKQVLHPEVININSLISELQGILDRILDKRIQLILRLSPVVGRIKADPSQLEQIILNLVINARDAMRDGGTVTIETSNVAIPRAATSNQLADDFVSIRISDTGTGMPPDVRAHIFEPFFTTKQKSGGTGLGLATVYGIVSQSGGSIDVDSKEGVGSIFTVYLPRHHGSPSPVRRAEPESRPAPGHQEIILLAEDRDDVREMLNLLLQTEGYRVIQARDGQDAVAVAESFPGDIKLMVTDVIMPNLSGPEAVRQIRQSRPDLKVVFVTGYAERPGNQAPIPSSITLEKPLRPESFLKEVSDLLEPRRSRTGTNG
jgi:two-component system cell cycle sensor histidine kinase/response regulator CckA